MTDSDLALAMRNALRRLAKAIVVITCRYEGKRFAMSATAVSELSMDPPSLLICVNKAASIHTPLTAGVDFCINILHASHEVVAALCGGKAKGEARFSEGDWAENAFGTPYLRGSQASFFCKPDGSHSYGTHDIFMGRLVGVTSTGPVDPLVYVDGRYTVLNLSTVIAT